MVFVYVVNCYGGDLVHCNMECVRWVQNPLLSWGQNPLRSWGQTPNIQPAASDSAGSYSGTFEPYSTRLDPSA